MKVDQAVASGLIVVASLSCTTRHESTGEKPASSAAVAGASGRSAPAAFPSVAPSPAVCALGQGEPGAICTSSGLPVFLAEVDAAIDELVQKRPELFDLDRVVGAKGYWVASSEHLYLGVAAILQEKGFCAGWDLTELQVKNSQAHSEQYDLVLSNGHIRRGAGSYRASCTPANFPLDPAQIIERVRVAFYSIECDDGRTPPRNGEGLLPVDCTGLVTATPKGKDDHDVDKRIHGPEIVWEIEQADDYVSVEDFPKVDFNKVVRGRDLGEFRLCATVQTHRGCLLGSVVE